jgi:hypothetical protein
MINRNPTNDWINRITYCTRCGSTIFWDDFSKPQMLQLGNKNLFTCMEKGCNLLFMNVPSQCCDREELDLIRLGLQGLGISEEDARTVALRLNKNPAAA